MSNHTVGSRRDEPIGRQTLIAFIAAFAVVVFLLTLAPAPVSAASTVRTTVVRGTLVVTGTPSADRIALRLSRTLPRRLQVDLGDNGSADRTFTLGSFARIDVEAGGGNDRIRLDTRNGSFTKSKPTLGLTTRFGLVTFTRALRNPFDAGNASLNLDDVEAIRVRPLGGDDEVHVGDLSGSDVVRVDADLAATRAGSTADLQADTVAVIGTVGDDAITVTAGIGEVRVDGLAAITRVSHADADLDTLAITTLDGTDGVAVAPAVLGLIQVSSGP